MGRRHQHLVHKFKDDAPRRDAMIGSLRVRVVDTGDAASGHAIVLVHGIGTSSRYFRPLIHELRSDARVVAMDLPGFGASSRPREALSIPDLARVVGSVVHDAGLTRPVLVGHSMGCQVVAELGVQEPDLASGLVLIGPTVDPEKRGAVRHFFMLTYNSLYEPWWVNLLLLADYVRCGPVQYLKTLRPMLIHRIDRALSTAQQRAVVVRGTRDMVALHDWATSATRLLSNGRLIEIPRHSHAAHATHPEGIAAICRDLLNG